MQFFFYKGFWVCRIRCSFTLFSVEDCHKTIVFNGVKIAWDCYRNNLLLLSTFWSVQVWFPNFKNTSCFSRNANSVDMSFFLKQMYWQQIWISLCKMELPTCCVDIIFFEYVWRFKFVKGTSFLHLFFLFMFQPFRYELCFTVPFIRAWIADPVLWWICRLSACIFHIL